MTDFDQTSWYSGTNYCEVGDFCGWTFGPTYAPNTALKPISSILKPVVITTLTPYCSVVTPTEDSTYFNQAAGLYQKQIIRRRPDDFVWNREFFAISKAADFNLNSSAAVSNAESTSSYTFSRNWTIALSDATTTKYFAIQLQYQPNVGCVNQHIPL